MTIWNSNVCFSGEQLEGVAVVSSHVTYTKKMFQSREAVSRKNGWLLSRMGV